MISIQDKNVHGAGTAPPALPPAVLRHAVFIMALGIIISLFTHMVWKGWQAVQSQAHDTVSNLSYIFTNDVHDVLERAVSDFNVFIPQITNADLEHRITPERKADMEARLSYHLQSFQAVNSYQVLDAEGRVLFTTAPDASLRIETPVPRQWLQAFRVNPSAPVLIQELEPGRMLIGSPLNKPDEPFRGLILAIINDSFLVHERNNLHIGQDFNVSIHDAASFATLLTTNISDHPPQHSWRDVAVEDIERGRLPAYGTVTAFPDGHARFYMAAHLQPFGLHILVTIPKAPFMAPWLHQGILLSILALLALTILIWMHVSQIRSESAQAIYAHDLEQSQNQLAQKSTMLEAILSTASDGLHIVDDQGCLVMASDSFYTMHGLVPDHVLGKHISTWNAEKFTEQFPQRLKQFLEPGAFHKFETRHRHTNGIEFDVEIYTRGIEIEGRNLIYCSIRDITERKRSEEKIKYISNLYMTRSKIDQLITRTTDRETLFFATCEYVVRFGICSGAVIFSHNPDSNVLVPHIWNEGQQYRGMELSAFPNSPDSISSIGLAFRDNLIHVVPDYQNSNMSPQIKELAISGGWKSGASFPIRRHGNPFAVLWVGSDRLQAFDNQALALLDEMTANISFAIDVLDQKHHQERADEQLRLAALVYNVSSEGMVITDPNGIIETINPAFSRLTGYDAHECIGKPINILKSGRHDQDFYRSMWDDIIATGAWQGEILNRRKTGEIISERLTIHTVFRADGTPLRRIGLFYDITEQKRNQEIIWQQANYDTLTGLANRRMFTERLEQELKFAKRRSLRVALLFIDLDHFKDVNDSLGHEMGDLLLKQVGEKLSSCVRATDTVGRLGGDEFTIIISEVDDPSVVDGVARKVLGTVADRDLLAGLAANVSASIGITLYPDDGETVSDLMKNADRAMYASKRLGRNRFCYFNSPEMET